MPITIGSNISSLVVQRQLGLSSSELLSTNERLSSGLRINRAKDDAAGLSIASSLGLNSRVYARGILNANDTISLLSIGQAAVGELTNIVTRITELAEQSANGVYSNTQRIALDREAQALRSEYNRIVATVQFNGLNPFDEDVGDVVTQVGFGSAESISVNTSDSLTRQIGDGTFNLFGTFAAATGASVLDTADFNGDGLADVVAVNTYDNGFSLFLGQESGGLGSAINFGSQRTVDMSVGDFNGDGLSDVVTIEETANTITVYLGTGTGTFQTGVSYALGGNGYDVEVGDVDGDGRDDVFAIDASNSRVKLFMAQAGGTFSAYTTIANANSALIVGDTTGDGRADLMTLSATSILVSYTNNGSGVFTAVQTTASFGSDGRTADINGDGIQDLIVSFSESVRVSLGTGNGTFTASTSYSTGGGSQISELAVGDLNGDGYLDIAAAVDSGTDNSAFVFLNSGSGTFGAGTSYLALSSGSSYSYGIVITDLDNDDTPEIAMSLFNEGEIAVFESNYSTSNTLETFSLLTRADSLEALDSMETARTRLATALGRFGSGQSRIEVAARNLGVLVENSTAAKSRIVDSDVAEEAARGVRSRILQQVGASVLAQANQQPQIAINLLRGL